MNKQSVSQENKNHNFSCTAKTNEPMEVDKTNIRLEAGGWEFEELTKMNWQSLGG